MKRRRRNRWNTNSLTTETINGIIQSPNRERRGMGITDVGSYISDIKEALENASSYISDIKEALENAIDEAETKEGNIESKVEELGRAKDELEAARGEVEEIFSALDNFDGDRLANAIDEATSLGVDD